MSYIFVEILKNDLPIFCNMLRYKQRILDISINIIKQDDPPLNWEQNYFELQEELRLYPVLGFCSRPLATEYKTVIRAYQKPIKPREYLLHKCVTPFPY